MTQEDQVSPQPHGVEDPGEDDGPDKASDRCDLPPGDKPAGETERGRRLDRHQPQGDDARKPVDGQEQRRRSKAEHGGDDDGDQLQAVGEDPEKAGSPEPAKAFLRFAVGLEGNRPQQVRDQARRHRAAQPGPGGGGNDQHQAGGQHQSDHDQPVRGVGRLRGRVVVMARQEPSQSLGRVVGQDGDDGDRGQRIGDLAVARRRQQAGRRHGKEEAQQPCGHLPRKDDRR